MHKIKNRVGPLQSGTCAGAVHGFDSNFVFLHPCLFRKELKKTNMAKEKTISLTPECVETAASLLGSMDSTADHCNRLFSVRLRGME